MTPTAPDISLVFIELGIAVIVLGLLARLASRGGFSPIPLYLAMGLALGNGGIMPLRFSDDFIHVGAEIGVILLLFLLGLEYTGPELGRHLRAGLPGGAADLLLNFTPGFVAGQMLGWGFLPSFLLGGVTYVTSSGLVARLLVELKRVQNKETSVVMGILVLEDLAMALYLPLVGVLLSGRSANAAVLGIGVAVATVVAILFIATRYGKAVSRIVAHQSDEVLLFTILGLVLLVAGMAQWLQVPAAVGAFLVGIAISGTIADRARALFEPLRDLFAAMFFLFFGLQIDPATLLPMLPAALLLAAVTLLTKMVVGAWAARRAGVDRLGALRAGAMLVPRGEFSIVIAGLGVVAGLTTALGALSAAYVVVLTIVGPLLARGIVPLDQAIARLLPARRHPKKSRARKAVAAED